MKKIKSIRHEKEFDTMTLITDIGEEPGGEQLTEPEPSPINDVSESSVSGQTASDRSTKESLDRKSLSDLRKDRAEGHPTQVYEPRPLTPEDEMYEDIIEQFATAPTKPKYWFEEFGDYWSCSCGQINKEDFCTSCGLERELLRSLFILHKPSDEYPSMIVPIEDSRAKTQTSSKGIKLDKKNKIIIAIAACIVLIGLCGFAIYKHLAAPAMQYEEASQLMSKGEYELAIEKFEDLGDYKDSTDMLWQCWVLWGDDFYKAGKFKKAITAYETAADIKKDDSIHEKIRLSYIGIGDKYMESQEYEKAIGSYTVAAEIAAGDDVVEKINAAKLAYVKAFQSERSEQVEAFLKELVEASYPGAKEVYDAYYAWNATIVANKSDSDYSTDVSTVSRKDTIYFHASLSGGEPSESIQLYYEVTWPDGHSEIYNLDSYWRAGDKITARFQYSIPLFGKEGKLTFTLYDKRTKESLGSDSVTFKN